MLSSQTTPQSTLSLHYISDASDRIFSLAVQIPSDIVPGYIKQRHPIISQVRNPLANIGRFLNDLEQVDSIGAIFANEMVRNLLLLPLLDLDPRTLIVEPITAAVKRILSTYLAVTAFFTKRPIQ